MLIEFIPQCKGKNFADAPLTAKIPGNEWLATLKYDGNYCQIHKKGDEIAFFTSGAKEFYIPNAADELRKIPHDFVIEAEFCGYGKGMLGDRVKASTGSYRKFKRGETTYAPDCSFKVFDLVALDGKMINSDPLTKLQKLKAMLPGEMLTVVEHADSYTDIETAVNLGKEYIKKGWEGVCIKHINHIYIPGKRVNTCLKVKGFKTADLLCIDTKPGEGKYEGLIGALVLTDKQGRIVSVGSGLCDGTRALDASVFIGQVIEIKYEQLLDTYIQPIFLGVRRDKTEADID